MAIYAVIMNWSIENNWKCTRKLEPISLWWIWWCQRQSPSLSLSHTRNEPYELFTHYIYGKLQIVFVLACFFPFDFMSNFMHLCMRLHVTLIGFHFEFNAWIFNSISHPIHNYMQFILTRCLTLMTIWHIYRLLLKKPSFAKKTFCQNMVNLNFHFRNRRSF